MFSDGRFDRHGRFYGAFWQNIPRAHRDLLTIDGKNVGQIKSIRTGDSSHKEAKQGEEVAIAIQGATVGRGIDEEDILLVDVPASHARRLRKLELTSSEQEILDELTALHRSENHFWGRERGAVVHSTARTNH